MANDTKFLSCDWGTTAFRLRLVLAEGFKILAEVSSKDGIAGTFKAWTKSGKAEPERVAFYRAVIGKHLVELESKAKESLSGIPLIISGMASANIGMTELPYKQMPFALDGSDLATKFIEASTDFPHPTLLISGVRTDDDVMRGEEVQVVGCGIDAQQNEQLVIHPGTHCKHIVVKGGQAISFQTFMTGELFSLFSTKSILATSVAKGGDINEQHFRSHFDAGVLEAGRQNLAHAAFMVRTGLLFGKRTKEENFYYLSGLLIGSELRDFPKDFRGNIILAGESVLTAQYKVAMDVCGITARTEKLTIMDADIITLAGQYAVYRNYNATSATQL